MASWSSSSKLECTLYFNKNESIIEVYYISTKILYSKTKYFDCYMQQLQPRDTSKLEIYINLLQHQYCHFTCKLLISAGLPLNPQSVFFKGNFFFNFQWREHFPHPPSDYFLPKPNNLNQNSQYRTTYFAVFIAQGCNPDPSRLPVVGSSYDSRLFYKFDALLLFWEVSGGKHVSSPPVFHKKLAYLDA